MWKPVIFLGCAVLGAIFASPIGLKNMSIMPDGVPQSETNDRTKITVSKLHLPSNATSIRADITDGFTCDDRAYGYYADVENECQIFHVCLPVVYPGGKENTFRWSFICPEETVFSQESFTCVREVDMNFNCEDSERFYELNRRFGTSTDASIEMSSVEVDNVMVPETQSGLLLKQNPVNKNQVEQEKEHKSTTTVVPNRRNHPQSFSETKFKSQNLHRRTSPIENNRKPTTEKIILLEETTFKQEPIKNIEKEPSIFVEPPQKPAVFEMNKFDEQKTTEFLDDEKIVEVESPDMVQSSGSGDDEIVEMKKDNIEVTTMMNNAEISTAPIEFEIEKHEIITPSESLQLLTANTESSISSDNELSKMNSEEQKNLIIKTITNLVIDENSKTQTTTESLKPVVSSEIKEKPQEETIEIITPFDQIVEQSTEVLKEYTPTLRNDEENYSAIPKTESPDVVESLLSSQDEAKPVITEAQIKLEAPLKQDDTKISAFPETNSSKEEILTSETNEKLSLAPGNNGDSNLDNNLSQTLSEANHQEMMYIIPVHIITEEPNVEKPVEKFNVVELNAETLIPHSELSETIEESHQPLLQEESSQIDIKNAVLPVQEHILNDSQRDENEIMEQTEIPKELLEVQNMQSDVTKSENGELQSEFAKDESEVHLEAEIKQTEIKPIVEEQVKDDNLIIEDIPVSSEEPRPIEKSEEAAQIILETDPMILKENEEEMPLEISQTEISTEEEIPTMDTKKELVQESNPSEIKEEERVELIKETNENEVLKENLKTEEISKPTENFPSQDTIGTLEVSEAPSILEQINQPIVNLFKTESLFVTDDETPIIYDLEHIEKNNLTSKIDDNLKYDLIESKNVSSMNMIAVNNTPVENISNDMPAMETKQPNPTLTAVTESEIKTDSIDPLKIALHENVVIEEHLDSVPNIRTLESSATRTEAGRNLQKRMDPRKRRFLFRSDAS